MPRVRLRACAAGAAVGSCPRPGTRRRRASPPAPCATSCRCPPGAETDIFARVLAKHLAETLGPAGPGGKSSGRRHHHRHRGGGEGAARRPCFHARHHARSASTRRSTRSFPYDTLKDFACITQIGNLYSVLLAHPSFPAKSVADLVKLAKARPGDITLRHGRRRDGESHCHRGAARGRGHQHRARAVQGHQPGGARRAARAGAAARNRTGRGVALHSDAAGCASSPRPTPSARHRCRTCPPWEKRSRPIAPAPASGPWSRARERRPRC